MNRMLLLILVGVFCSISALVPVAAPIGFLAIYEPSEEEIGTLFNLQAYLAQYNDDTAKDPEDDIHQTSQLISEAQYPADVCV